MHLFFIGLGTLTAALMSDGAQRGRRREDETYGGRVRGGESQCEALVRYLQVFPREGYNIQEMALTYSKASPAVQDSCRFELDRMIAEDAAERGISFRQQVSEFKRLRDQAPPLLVDMRRPGGGGSIGRPGKGPSGHDMHAVMMSSRAGPPLDTVPTESTIAFLSRKGKKALRRL